MNPFKRMWSHVVNSFAAPGVREHKHGPADPTPSNLKQESEVHPRVPEHSRKAHGSVHR